MHLASLTLDNAGRYVTLKYEYFLWSSASNMSYLLACLPASCWTLLATVTRQMPFFYVHFRHSWFCELIFSDYSFVVSYLEVFNRRHMYLLMKSLQTSNFWSQSLRSGKGGGGGNTSALSKLLRSSANQRRPSLYTGNTLSSNWFAAGVLLLHATYLAWVPFGAKCNAKEKKHNKNAGAVALNQGPWGIQVKQAKL